MLVMSVGGRLGSSPIEITTAWTICPGFFYAMTAGGITGSFNPRVGSKRGSTAHSFLFYPKPHYSASLHCFCANEFVFAGQFNQCILYRLRSWAG